LAPNETPVAPVNPVPVTTTVSVAFPVFGATAVTVGAAVYVNLSPATATLVPAGVVTRISTEPAGPEGDVAVICVAEFTT
jgi:hypothetical protein